MTGIGRRGSQVLPTGSLCTRVLTLKLVYRQPRSLRRRLLLTDSHFERRRTVVSGRLNLVGSLDPLLLLAS